MKVQAYQNTVNKKMQKKKEKKRGSGHYKPFEIRWAAPLIFTHVVQSLSFAGHLEITI